MATTVCSLGGGEEEGNPSGSSYSNWKCARKARVAIAGWEKQLLRCSRALSMVTTRLTHTPVCLLLTQPSFAQTLLLVSH